MKKIVLFLSFIALLGFINKAQAQVNVNVNINSQPAWGPTGYNDASYYYFPSLNVYFDVNNSLFYYLSGSKWTSNRYLPNKYSKNDLYNTYKVVINDKKTPWQNNTQHKKEYAQYKNNNKQEVIRNSNDERYAQSKKNTTPWVNSNSNSNKQNSQKNNNRNNNNNIENNGERNNSNNRR